MSTDEGTAVGPDRPPSAPPRSERPLRSERSARWSGSTRAARTAKAPGTPKAPKAARAPLTPEAHEAPEAPRAERRAAPGPASTGSPLALRRPSWTQRDHPVFVPLASFFGGLLLVLFTFGLLGAIVSQVLGYDAAGTVFPYFFVMFVVPLVLIGFRATRRWGLYMLLGMVLTALVVIGVAAVTLYFLLAGDG